METYGKKSFKLENNEQHHFETSLNDRNAVSVSVNGMNSAEMLNTDTSICVLNSEDLHDVSSLFRTGIISPESNQLVVPNSNGTISQEGNEEVMHLQIQHTAPEGMEVQNAGHQVFYIYRDAFTCGACSKSFDDLVAFMEHKAQHTLADNVYRCELCKIIIVNQQTLIEHYASMHNVTLASSENEVSFSSINDLCEPHVGITNLNQQVSKRKPESRKQKLQVTKDLSSEDDIPTSPLVNMKEKQNSTVSLSMSDSNIKECKQDNHEEVLENSKDSGSVKDFNFILLSETIKGAKLTYTRTWFKCFHCDFRTRMKRCLIKHMGDTHFNLISMHSSMSVPDEDPASTYAHKVGETHSRLMKLSTYDHLYPMTGKKKKRRIEKQDLPGVFTCNQCGKVFSRLRYLRKHSLTHQKLPAEKRFACEVCGKTFRFKNYLRVHQNSHKTKLFKCNECDFESNINAAIHAHRQIHNQGSVLCDVCGFAYTDKSTLTKHKRVHDMTRPFACNYPGCTWRFKTEIMCKAHIRAHTTEGKFPCWICGYVFRHKHHLQRHLKKMHDMEVSGKELDAHCNQAVPQISGTEYKPAEMQCFDCGLAFTSRAARERHEKKAHGIKSEVDDLYHGHLLANGNSDNRIQVITAIAPEDFDQADQQVYVSIDNGGLVNFDQNLDMNTLYVQEEQEVQINDEEVRDEKSFFVSVL